MKLTHVQRSRQPLCLKYSVSVGSPEMKFPEEAWYQATADKCGGVKMPSEGAWPQAVEPAGECGVLITQRAAVRFSQTRSPAPNKAGAGLSWIRGHFQ